MKIKKLEINGIDTHIYDTKRYSSINMRFVFEIPYTKENMHKCDILEEYMIYTTRKFRTRKELNERRMSLYSLGYSLNNYNIGEQLFVEASFSFCDPKLIKDDYLKEAMEFASEIIFEPNFVDGKSDPAEMERCRGNLKMHVADRLLDNNYKAMRSYVDIAHPNTYRTVDAIYSNEEYEKILNNITDEDLLKFHKEVFLESCVGLIIMGSIEDEYLDYIKTYFNFPKSKKLNKNYNRKVKINRKTDYYTKNTDPAFHESILRCAYDCPARSRKDEIIYSVIASMIGSSGLILHKVLREELKIVYRTSAGYGRHSCTLMMYAFLDKENEETALKGFDKVIEMMKDKSLVTDLLAKIKEEDELSMYTYYENKWNPFGNLFNRAFSIDIDDAKSSKIVQSLTVEDIISHVMAMEKVKVHFYEGGKE